MIALKSNYILVYNSTHQTFYVMSVNPYTKSYLMLTENVKGSISELEREFLYENAILARTSTWVHGDPLVIPQNTVARPATRTNFAAGIPLRALLRSR